MKKLFIIVLTIFLFPLSLISQTPQIEPSWELSPYNSSLNEIELIPTDFVETNSDCGIVSFIYMPRLIEVKNNSKDNNNLARIVKFGDNGEFLQEIELKYDSNYYITEIDLDIWNDTINVFALLTSMEEDHFVLIHTYLFDDLSTSEHKEIWRKEFYDGLEWKDAMLLLEPLIDDNGCRTFHFEYSTSNIKDRLVIILKLDDNYNVISEREYNCLEDLIC